MSKNKKKYIIVTALHLDELENSVNNYIDDGYEVVGGVMVNTGATLRFLQAVKYKPVDEGISMVNEIPKNVSTLIPVK